MIALLGREFDVYGDELFSEDGSNWMYIGILFVPLNIKSELLNELLNKRCIQSNSWKWNKDQCSSACDFHEDNNTEIHYSEIDKLNARFRIGYRWIHEFLIEENNKNDKGLVYFNILGLDLSKMNLRLFGKESKDLAIYNRFFRATLKSGANYFFGVNNKKTVRQMYHDRGKQESHDLFSWHVGYKINIEGDKNLQIDDEEIRFVDSDHRTYLEQDENLRDEAQFIQFIDLILGSIYCCLHNPSKNEKKREIGLAILPLLSRLLKNPDNKNSSHNYYKRQQVQFFPKYEDSETRYFEQLKLYGDRENREVFPKNFYTNRDILLLPREQTTLEDFY